MKTSLLSLFKHKMKFQRNKSRKGVQSAYHLNDNIEQLFQESSLLQQYHYDSTFDQAPRSKRLYQEVLKEQEFLRNCRTVWKNKLASLQEDARLIEKMKQCSKGNLANVPPLFDRDTIFASPGESTSQQQEAPSSPPSNTYNQEEPSPSLNSPEIEISEMLEDTPQEEEEEEEEEDKEELALPDIDLSVLIEEVDENDDNAVRRALDLMLKQFGDSL